MSAQDWPIQGGVNLLPSVGHRELLITGYVLVFLMFLCRLICKGKGKRSMAVSSAPHRYGNATQIMSVLFLCDNQ